MSYQSEVQLEKNLVNQLESQGFSIVKIKDEEELKNNFRLVEDFGANYYVFIREIMFLRCILKLVKV